MYKYIHVGKDIKYTYTWRRSLAHLRQNRFISKMEAPNAPHPENPNAQGNPNQGQNQDQNQDQTQDQNKDQVPAGQVPVPQPVPAQQAPAGVVPVPQIIYQNWIGKKPEFSGKPEEDAESHLLSTRDWMEVHNFPEGEKVRRV